MQTLANTLDDVSGNRNLELENAMRSRLGVKGDFIRVRQLAKALGISGTSIHSQIRRGTFPIPHRRVGNVVLVRLSDYMMWFEDGSRGVSTVAEPVSADTITGPLVDELQSFVADAPSIDRKRESRAEFKARMDREVLSEMRSKGFDV